MGVVIDYTSGFFEAAPTGETVGSITGNATLDLTSGNVFSHTPTANTTFAFSNPPASGTGYDFTLKVTGANVTAGYDIANASYDSVSFSVSGQESAPRGIFFKPDGYKMYVIGEGSDTVNQYDLSTAWDVSSASYVQNFSVATQENRPTSVFFKPDGTKMYVLGRAGDDVNEYDLSTAWDISTASYLQNFSVSVQDNTPWGIFFKPDGTKMYMSGLSNDSIFEYDLSTAWDISTASYSQNYSVATQENTPTEVNFNPDGTKLFVLGNQNDSVYEYDLSTAWDISTASYNSVSFSLTSQEANPYGFRFSTDGLKMYVLGFDKFVYQYSTGSSALATIAYPSSVKWAGGTAPTAPANGETDVYSFFTTDGGTNYYGFQAGDALA